MIRDHSQAHWWSFLSGLPEEARRRRYLMPMQVFADDSGTKGDTLNFVMAGLVAHSDEWMHFSDEWQGCLNETPRIKIFKMRDAANCSGQFYGVSTQKRDEKLKRLAQIINRYVGLCTYTAINLEAHTETWGKTNKKPRNDPYFWPFQNTITATMLSLWEAGWRERFEVIFDEQMISGPRAKEWYPLMKRVAQFKEPEAATILPIEPLFRTDDEFLPIQAADLFAWCIRKATDDPSYTAFAWLLDEMKSVKQSVHAQYYDKQRMLDVSEDSASLAKEGAIPEDIIELARKLQT